jgi:Rieske Fe-S protein
MNDPKYSSLLGHLAYLAIPEKNIIITNWASEYACALNSCTFCSGGFKGNNQPGGSTWICQSCKSEFSALGEVRKGPAVTGIKVYPIVRSGNTLTISLTR